MNVNELQVFEKLEDDEKGVQNVDTHGGSQKVTTKELAEALGVDISTIQKEVSSLGIKSERIGESHTMIFI